MANKKQEVGVNRLYLIRYIFRDDGRITICHPLAIYLIILSTLRRWDYSGAIRSCLASFRIGSKQFLPNSVYESTI